MDAPSVLSSPKRSCRCSTMGLRGLVERFPMKEALESELQAKFQLPSVINNATGQHLTSLLRPPSSYLRITDVVAVTLWRSWHHAPPGMWEDERPPLCSNSLLGAWFLSTQGHALPCSAPLLVSAFPCTSALTLLRMDLKRKTYQPGCQEQSSPA